MKTTKKHWSVKDLQTYILLFCINANWTLKRKYKDYLINKLCDDAINGICREFSSDNDYQAMQKMKLYMTEQRFSHAQEEQVFEKVRRILCAHDALLGNEKLWFKRLKNVVI